MMRRILTSRSSKMFPRLERVALMSLLVVLRSASPVWGWTSPIRSCHGTSPIEARSGNGCGFRQSSFLAATAIEHSEDGSVLTKADLDFLQEAVDCARNGLGHTFPNPAVGCILVQDDKILGRGFHPRAGYPHAEVFALMEALNYVPDGVVAAQAVVDHYQVRKDPRKTPDADRTNLIASIEKFTELYRKDASKVMTPIASSTAAQTSSDDRESGGASSSPVITAYVTLEPCCHFGKTPPCAASLAMAGVDRVVLGYRDPNPRVNGGGMLYLQNEDVQVLSVADDPNAQPAHNSCSQLVTDFAKRIAPRAPAKEMTGAYRSALRSVAGRGKANGSLPEVAWGDGPVSLENDDNVELRPEWMEHLDNVMWNHELVLVRLNQAVKKKKQATLLGKQIAQALDAQVVQTVGHTCLLYRAGVPPVLDLDELIKPSEQEDDTA